MSKINFILRAIAGLSNPRAEHMKYTIYFLYEGQLTSSHPTYKLSKIGFQCYQQGQCTGEKRAGS